MAIPRQRIHLPPRSWRRAYAGWRRGELWEGEALARFERAIADEVGVAEAISVPSGRIALRFLLEALDLEPGSEVICCAFGYPVVPYLVREAGHRLRLVDCELRTMGMDPEGLEAVISERTSCVITTHLYGTPCRVREIARIAEAHGAVLLEDCAHSLGARVGDRSTGAVGRAGYFSFETSKILNTMGGGMITTADRELAERLRKIAGAQPPNGFPWLSKRLLKTSFEALVTHPLGFNLIVYPALRFVLGEREQFTSGYAADTLTVAHKLGRYTSYQAELGLAQLDNLAPLAERRRKNSRFIVDRLSPRVPFQGTDEPDVKPNPMLLAARFANAPEVARALLARGIDTKRGYMRDCSGLLQEPAELPNAARVDREVLHVPAFPALTEHELDRVATALEAVLDELGD
jgi:dTDP-4-amino-4,6-dideoxygalactose transaminase